MHLLHRGFLCNCGNKWVLALNRRDYCRFNRTTRFTTVRYHLGKSRSKLQLLQPFIHLLQHIQYFSQCGPLTLRTAVPIYPRREVTTKLGVKMIHHHQRHTLIFRETFLDGRYHCLGKFTNFCMLVTSPCVKFFQ